MIKVGEIVQGAQFPESVEIKKKLKPSMKAFSLLLH